MTEQLIMKIGLPSFKDLSLVDAIVSLGYARTGNKFTVAFNGSKGYLSNIEISCEGHQKEENRIFIENLRNKNGSLKSILVNIFYSDENGIRISTGNDQPKVIRGKVEANSSGNQNTANDEDDLPF